MSLTQTYYIAASARSKLGKEACRADHDLRLLVGHANLLDSLMVELQDAERQQEQWFNQTMAKASKSEEPRHIQWADSIAEEEDDDDESDSDSENEDDFDMIPLPRRIAQSPVQISTMEVDDDEDEDEFYDDMEDDSELALTRVPSQLQSPPELTYEEVTTYIAPTSVFQLLRQGGHAYNNLLRRKTSLARHRGPSAVHGHHRSAHLKLLGQHINVF